MRSLALLACLCLTAAAGAPRQPLETLNPAQAISRAAASPKPVRALFQFRVENAAKARDGYFLDSEKDFHSQANLGVAIRASAMPGLTRKFGADLKAAFIGKQIKLIGEVRRVSVGGKGRTATATQIEVTHSGQILAVS